MGVPKGRARPDSNRSTNDDAAHAFVFRFDPVSNVGPLRGPTHRRPAALARRSYGLGPGERDEAFLRDSVPLWQT